MNDEIKTADELKTIRRLMEESARFLSLSGLSGVFAGFIAIAGAFAGWFFILEKGETGLENALCLSEEGSLSMKGQTLILIAAAIFILSIVSAIMFSSRNASRKGRSLWTPVSRRMLLSLFIPLVSGAVLSLFFLLNNDPQYIIPSLLIFYGLALVGAGKFTYGEVFYLGILEILTGFISLIVPGWQVILWMTGFGLLHIGYGLFMFRKYGA